MLYLEVKSWKRGLQTVSLIRAVYHHSTHSLARAKEEVERLLAGETVRFEFENEVEAEEFRKKAKEFGAIFSEE